MAASRSASHLLAKADSDKLMVIISASRKGQEIYPNATMDMEREVRQAGYKPTTHQLRDHPLEKEIEGGKPISLQNKLDTTKLGIARTIGGYPEEGEDVRELSLVVSHPNPAPPVREILEFFIGLAARYQQIGVVIKLPDEQDAYEYFPDRRPRKLYGRAGFAKQADYFTKLRKGPKNRHMIYNPPDN